MRTGGRRKGRGRWSSSLERSFKAGSLWPCEGLGKGANEETGLTIQKREPITDSRRSPRRGGAGEGQPLEGCGPSSSEAGEKHSACVRGWAGRSCQATKRDAALRTVCACACACAHVYACAMQTMLSCTRESAFSACFKHGRFLLVVSGGKHCGSDFLCHSSSNQVQGLRES